MPLVLHIVNAGKSSFPEAWPGYRGCASYNADPQGSGWFRVATEYNDSDGVLTFRLTPEKVGRTSAICKLRSSTILEIPLVKVLWTQDCVFFAYFAPYSYERHLQLVAEMQSQRSDLVQHTVLGKSLQGRPIDLLTISKKDSHKKGDKVAHVWIIARQHPGEASLFFGI